MDDYRLASLTLQLTYPSAFVLWDRAGELTASLAQIWPGFKLEKADPGVVVGRSSEARLQTALETSYVNLIRPRTVTTSSEKIALSVKEWIRFLELGDITKIGMRALYHRDFPSREASFAASRKLNLIKLPARDVFDCRADSELNSGAVSYQFENDASLTKVRLYQQDLAVELEQTEEFPELSGRKEVHRLVIDVDRQTKQKVEASNIRTEELLKGFQHLLRRDLPAIFFE